MKTAIDRLIACYVEQSERCITVRWPLEVSAEREDLLVALQILTNVEEDLL